MLKKIVCGILFVIGMIACEQRDPIASKEIIGEDLVKSQLGVLLKQKINEQPELHVNNLLNSEEEVLFDYVMIKYANGKGLVYVIPYRDTTLDVIKGCLVFPISTTVSEDIVLNNVALTEPILINAKTLGNVDNKNFAVANWLIEWEKEGLVIEMELVQKGEKMRTDFTRDIDGLSLSELQIDIPKTRTSSPAGIYSIEINYDIVPYVYWNNMHELVVIGMSFYDMERIFRDVLYEWWSDLMIRQNPTVEREDLKILAVLAINWPDNKNIYTFVDGFLQQVSNEIFIRNNVRVCYYDAKVTRHGNASMGEGEIVTLGNGPNGSYFNAPLPVIDHSNLKSEPYINCIYEKFVANSSKFDSYLEQFLGEKPIAHLNWKLDDKLGDKVAGAFNPALRDFWFTIELNPNLLKRRPPLAVAKTLFHEALHANFAAKLLAMIDPPTPGDISIEEYNHIIRTIKSSDYPGILYYYEKYCWPVTADHELMSEFYVNIIAGALLEFDPNASFLDCLALAWEGLKYTIEVEWNEELKKYEVKYVETEGWKKCKNREKLNKALEDYLSNAPIKCD